MDYDKYKSSDELAKRISVDRLSDIIMFPKYLMIEPTNACNAKCIMCPHSTEVTKVHIMKDELFEKILSEMQEYREWIESVAIYWFGEPLLDNNVDTKIAALKRIGIKSIQLSTNGACLTENLARRIFEAGLNDLRFSVDGVNKSTFEKIRVGLVYEDVINNIINAIKIRNSEYPDASIRIRLTESKDNSDEIEEFVEFWKKYVGDRDLIQIMPLHTKENWALEEVRGKYKEMGLEDYPCISPFSTMVIDSEGVVALCCQDSDKQEVLGDVKKQSLKEIWNDSKIDNIRIRHLTEGRQGVSTCSTCICWDREFSIK